MNLNNVKIILQAIREKLFFSFLLFNVILLFFGLYRRTVIHPIFAFISDNVNGSLLVVSYIFFPVFSFCIPLFFIFLNKKKKEKLVYIDLVFTLLICLIFMFSIPQLESIVSNTDIYTSKYVIKSTDRDRKSNFVWLRISITSMTFGQIISDLQKEEKSR